MATLKGQLQRAEMSHTAGASASTKLTSRVVIRVPPPKVPTSLGSSLVSHRAAFWNALSWPMSLSRRYKAPAVHAERVGAQGRPRPAGEEGRGAPCQPGSLEEDEAVPMGEGPTRTATAEERDLEPLAAERRPRLRETPGSGGPGGPAVGRAAPPPQPQPPKSSGAVPSFESL